MAWSSVVDSGDRLQAMDDLKPCFLADHQLLEVYASASTGGVWNETGDPEDPDCAASGYPVYRAYDGFFHDTLITKPDEMAADWYLAFDLTSSPITFDSIVIKGENLTTADDITVEIADSADFTSNKQSILALDTSEAYGPATGTISNRNVHTWLDHNRATSRIYSNVAYLRINFAVDSGTYAPWVTEVWLGTRRQLLDWPDVPWNDADATASIRGGRTRAGITATEARHYGRARRSPTVAIGDSDDLAPFTSWWSDCFYGARSFVWIEPTASNTEPIGYLMAYDGPEPDLNPILRGPNERRITVPMAEICPFYSQD